MATTGINDNGGNNVADEMVELFKATNKEKPAPADLERLRKHFVEHPNDIALLGDLTNQVESRLCDTFKHSQIMIISLQGYCKTLRKELGYKGAPMLEKTLIDHVVICWMRMHICELQYETYTKGATLTVATFWENTLSATQKRYLRACETLARIRKLNINIQVNIGDKQVITR